MVVVSLYVGSPEKSDARLQALAEAYTLAIINRWYIFDPSYAAYQGQEIAVIFDIDCGDEQLEWSPSQFVNILEGLKPLTLTRSGASVPLHKLQYLILTASATDYVDWDWSTTTEKTTPTDRVLDQIIKQKLNTPPHKVTSCSEKTPTELHTARTQMQNVQNAYTSAC